jgi:AraC-like DNA-binding protein
MPDDPSPAVTEHAFSTTDPGLAEDVLRAAYSENRLVLTGPPTDFTFGHTTIEAPGFSINRLRAEVDLTFLAESTPQDPYLVVVPVSGRLAYLDSGYDDTYVDAGAPILVPPQSRMRVVCEHLDDVVVPLDPDEVAAHAAATTGITPDELVFTGITPIGPAMQRNWNATVAHVRATVLDRWAGAQPVLVAQAFRSLATALLSTFPNTALAHATDPETPRPRGRVSAAALREVIDYIDTHADLPLGPTRVTELAGMPAREITEALRRRYGRHPAELLWRARLRGVRRDLLDADPQTDTVDDLAARWGFGRSGRFRVAYARAFAEPPEDTLRR